MPREGGDMAGALNVRHGSKMRLAFDAPLGQEPKFNMICTFNKAPDESAFLVSIPVGGKALLDEKQKFLFQYEEGETRLSPDMWGRRERVSATIEGSPRQ